MATSPGNDYWPMKVETLRRENDRLRAALMEIAAIDGKASISAESSPESQIAFRALQYSDLRRSAPQEKT